MSSDQLEYGTCMRKVLVFALQEVCGTGTSPDFHKIVKSWILKNTTEHACDGCLDNVPWK